MRIAINSSAELVNLAELVGPLAHGVVLLKLVGLKGRIVGQGSPVAGRTEAALSEEPRLLTEDAIDNKVLLLVVVPEVLEHSIEGNGELLLVHSLGPVTSSSHEDLLSSELVHAHVHVHVLHPASEADLLLAIVTGRSTPHVAHPGLFVILDLVPSDSVVADSEEVLEGLMILIVAVSCLDPATLHLSFLELVEAEDAVTIAEAAVKVHEGGFSGEALPEALHVSVPVLLNVIKLAAPCVVAVSREVSAKEAFAGTTGMLLGKGRSIIGSRISGSLLGARSGGLGSRSVIISSWGMSRLGAEGTFDLEGKGGGGEESRSEEGSSAHCVWKSRF